MNNYFLFIWWCLDYNNSLQILYSIIYVRINSIIRTRYNTSYKLFGTFWNVNCNISIVTVTFTNHLDILLISLIPVHPIFSHHVSVSYSQFHKVFTYRFTYYLIGLLLLFLPSSDFHPILLTGALLLTHLSTRDPWCFRLFCFS